MIFRKSLLLKIPKILFADMHTRYNAYYAPVLNVIYKESQ